MLAHERIGDGAPLVLIHGIGHRRQGWYPVVDHLAEHREVILVDLPGHGESPAFDAQGRPARDYLADVFADFYGELGLGRPHVAGNSLGGLVALESANHGRVSSVTALSPAGFWHGDQDFAYVERIFRSVVVAAGLTHRAAPLLARTPFGRALMFGWITARPGRIEREAAVGDLQAMLRARPALRELLAQAYTFTPELPDDVPVTIAWGSRDVVLRPYQARRARSVLPDATHLWLPRCGHVPMSDRPRMVADVLLRGSAGPLLAADDLAAVS